MREILFRGKRTFIDEWVFGDLAHFPDRTVIDTHKQGQPWRGFDVFPETVGQFTGRTDKNGKKVFEGDIIKLTAFPPQVFYGVIVWDDNDQCYLVAQNPSKYVYIGEFGNYGKPEYYEVIGNIHDNPELLEGAV